MTINDFIEYVDREHPDDVELRKMARLAKDGKIKNLEVADLAGFERVAKDKDDDKKLDDLAKELAAERGISKASAYDEILSSDAKRYSEYLASNDWSTRPKCN